MNELKNITPKNDRGQRHGIWEWYHPNGELWFKGNYLNGKSEGYWEWCYHDGEPHRREYYII